MEIVKENSIGLGVRKKNVTNAIVCLVRTFWNFHSVRPTFMVEMSIIDKHGTCSF